MGYFYNAGDSDASVAAGAAGITWSRVIQNPDPHGGYNTMFTSGVPLAYYHVHFFAGGTRVSVIRYFGPAAQQGSNIIVHSSGETWTFAKLQYDCRIYPNHFQMLNNFKAAIQNVRRNPRNELT